MILFRYRWSMGFVLWAVHRLTGIALTLYLFVHLYILASLRDPEKFESLMGMMRHPLVKVSELGLMVLLGIHALNGVRVTLLEMGMTTRFHKPAAVIGAALLAVLVMAGAVTFFGSAH